ncbi:4'-phosphopantetheinyl transferase superfamily protein [Streptomyces sp. ISL-10]|uniref:4'-phosphopantetheinyl transferase family protein n=1 Tax=Streptomyces sp. ISL-10 TaxID=2819172 RepID=UPI001BE82F15|nr:4'-phosphopantetheinyl transferase superfamily protein [Streptomyces sp. ISL-10]MBT2364808.1 4'-phosphopantetheinyl transferase superfamily protein [Streptomyces sp. ISL-10]
MRARRHIELLLPQGAAGEAEFGPVPPGVPLAGEAPPAGVVPERVHEFAAVRHCARRALARLGHPPVPLPAGERGAPVWPTGIVGSMTHCRGYRAAAVARSTGTAALGIDAEPATPLDDGVLGLICTTAELRHLAALARSEPAVPWDRMLFSAKEAVYKAWFPLTGRGLEFRDAQLSFLPGSDRFVVRVHGAPELSAAMHGRWTVAHGLVLTSVAVPARSLPAAGTGRHAANAEGRHPWEWGAALGQDG